MYNGLRTVYGVYAVDNLLTTVGGGIVICLPQRADSSFGVMLLSY